MPKLKLIRITTVPASLNTLLRGQLKYMKQFYDVYGVSSDGSRLKEVEQREDIKTFAVNMTRTISPFKDLKALFQLIRLFRAEKPAIVHTHTPKAGTLGMIAAMLAGVPIRMHTVAGLPLLETSGMKRSLLNIVEKITYSCATAVYPNSIKLKEIILQSKFCKATKLKVIGNGSSNGIDITHYDPSVISDECKTALKNKIGIKNNDTVFSFVGRMVKDKGVEELVRAFIKLYDQNKNIRLVLVGSFEKDLDPLSEEIENIIFNHSNIYAAGHQKDVRVYFSITDVFVFPSYREGFPNVVMQAGAMGVPSVVSDINGCNEIIMHGTNGLIVPPKDTESVLEAMNKMLTEKDSRIEMSSKCRDMIISRYSQQFVWEHLLEEYRQQASLYNISE